MDDKVRLLILFICVGLLIIITLIIISILKKRKNSYLKLEEKKVYDLPASSSNVQLFGIDTKGNNTQNQKKQEEDLDKTQIISLKDSSELERIAEVKELINEETIDLPKLN